MSKNLRVAELDFDSIKENLKSFLRTKSEFTDYDFEGSGLSVLIDLLSYNTHYNAVIGNMLVQEMYLDTAVKRQSLGLIAKRLGYTPRSITAPLAKISLEIFPQGNPSTITVNKNTKFSSRLSFDSVATFVTRDSYTVNRSAAGRYLFDSINVYEGSNDVFRYIVTGAADQRFEIPSTKADTSLLRVFVQSSFNSTDVAEWQRFDRLVDINSTTNTYFLKYNENGRYEVYFGDGILGRQIPTGAIVTLDYVTTNGDVANGAKVFTLSDTIQANSTYVITSIVPAFGGAAEEDSESIRINAQNSVFAQNRAVTESDYIAEINKIFPNDTVAVYGGETLSPPVYGKVFISIKQSGTTDTLSFQQKTELLNHLRKKTVLSITHDFIDPEYIYLVIDSQVQYDTTYTELSSDTIKSNILTAIEQYAQTNLDRFNSTFEYSRFVAAIDNANTAIISNDTKVLLKKRKSVILGVNTDYMFNFYTEIEPSNSKEFNVRSNAFRLESVPNTDCYLIDSDGIMKVYYMVNGVPTYLTDNVGTVDYLNGLIKINLAISESATGYLEFKVEPQSALIVPSRNNILTIDDSDLTVTLSVHK